MSGYEVVAGLAVSFSTGIVGKLGNLSGGVRQLIVVVFSAAVALVLAGKELTVQNYLEALVAVFAFANAGHAAAKYTARAVAPEKGDAPQ